MQSRQVKGFRDATTKVAACSTEARIGAPLPPLRCPQKMHQCGDAGRVQQKSETYHPYPETYNSPNSTRKDGWWWMLFWSLKQRDVSYEAIRMDNGHSLPCAQSGQTGQAKEKRFKRQRKKVRIVICKCLLLYVLKTSEFRLVYD